MKAHRLRNWITAATDRAILSRSILTCLIVGALLTAINHGDQLLSGEFNSTMAWQIGLTFLVPFLVASISGAAAIQSRVDYRRDDMEHPDGGQARDVDLDVESSVAVRR